MKILGLFIVLVIILNTISMAICSLIEQYSSYVSLLAFLGFFVLNFIVAWKVALWITERYLERGYRPAA